MTQEKIARINELAHKTSAASVSKLSEKPNT